MPRPMQGIGDPNNGGGVIFAANPTVLNTGRPTACIGDPVTPHDRKPVHFAVVATGNGRCLCGGRPIARIGDFDRCGHARLGGNPTVLC